MTDWYPWYPVLYKADTLGLTLAEDGAYRRLIDEYMSTRRPLPDSDVCLARVVGVSTDEWMAVAANVRQFFCARKGTLIHKRCSQELDEQDRRQKHKSEIGKKGALTRKVKSRKLKGNFASAEAEVKTVSTTVQYKTETTPLPPEPKPRSRPTLEAALATSSEEFFKNNSLLNHKTKTKTNGSAGKAFPESVGAILGISEDRRQDGPDYDDPAVRKARWRQKMHNWMIETLGMESEFVADLWRRYDACDMVAINGVEQFARDMRAEEQVIRAIAGNRKVG